jgi:hypothetical protein
MTYTLDGKTIGVQMVQMGSDQRNLLIKRDYMAK